MKKVKNLNAYTRKLLRHEFAARLRVSESLTLCARVPVCLSAFVFLFGFEADFLRPHTHVHTTLEHMLLCL